MIAPDPTTAWADRLAADLPPLDPSEAAQVGRLAAALDARTAETRQPTRGAA